MFCVKFVAALAAELDQGVLCLPGLP